MENCQKFCRMKYPIKTKMEKTGIEMKKSLWYNICIIINSTVDFKVQRKKTVRLTFSEEEPDNHLQEN